MITYRHSPHGVHSLMWRTGKGVVAYSRELIPSQVFAYYGHDGELIGIEVIKDDEEAGGSHHE